MDRRTDIYALGCILHEMLSGANPFAANTPESALAKKVTGTVPDLTTLRPDVPHTVQAVVQQATAADPAARHVTATEFVGALQTAMTLRAQDAAERRRWRRNVFRWGIGAAGALGLSAGAWWAAQSLNAPRMERIAVLPFRNAANDTTGFLRGRLPPRHGGGVLQGSARHQPRFRGAVCRNNAGHLQAALEAFHLAMDADPTDSQIRAYYSQVLLYLDRDDEALAEVERAASQDPFNTLVQGLYAQDLVFLKRYDAAEAVLARARARDPDAPYVLATLRTTYHLLGRHEDAMDMWRASYRVAGDDEALAALEDGWARGGYSEALRAVAELFAVRARTEYVTPWQIATLYTRAGDAGPALEYLELAYRDHDQNMMSILVDPIFDFIRDEPRFQALVDSLGLPR